VGQQDEVVEVFDVFEVIEVVDVVEAVGKEEVGVQSEDERCEPRIIYYKNIGFAFKIMHNLTLD
jgi:hypothetical protein